MCGVILGLLGDLALPAAALLPQRRLGARAFHDVDDVLAHRLRRAPVLGVVLHLLLPAPPAIEIATAPRRERVCQYVELSQVAASFNNQHTSKTDHTKATPPNPSHQRYPT